MRAFDYGGAPPDRRLAEEMLAVPTAILRELRGHNPTLAELDLDAGLERLRHEWTPLRGSTIHLEVHDGDPTAPTVVIAPGLGDHCRRHTPLAIAIAGRGLNVIGVDRLGHGLSEGRRGDAPLAEDFAVLELAIRRARSLSTGPVVLLGDSLGGVMSWYLLTREPDIDAAICHCIGHPDVSHDPAVRFKAPLIRVLARIAPRAPIPVRQIADYEHVALDPVTKRHFDQRTDRLFNDTVSVRSAASYLAFEPGIAWERVSVPVLVLIGAEDRMTTPAFTRESFERGHPPRAEYVEIPGAGHQLFLDHLGDALPPVLAWLEASIGVPAATPL